jgi:hypothetical protein
MALELIPLNALMGNIENSDEVMQNKLFDNRGMKIIFTSESIMFSGLISLWII